MTLDEISELHNINPIGNLDSIFASGILSHEGVKKLKHTSVAMADIQDIRAKVVLPNGKRLHSYANLYFNARNAMMYKRKDMHDQLCVLRIDKGVLALPKVVVSDQNAASEYVRFSDALKGLSLLDRETVFARSWYYANDQIRTWRHRAAMCCEVLVPNRVPPEYIIGVYASCKETESSLRSRFPQLNVVRHSDLFFL